MLKISNIVKWLLIIFFLPLVTNAQKTTKPNIFFIYSDDLGYGDMNVFVQASGKLLMAKVQTAGADKNLSKDRKTNYDKIS